MKLQNFIYGPSITHKNIILQQIALEVDEKKILYAFQIYAKCWNYGLY